MLAELYTIKSITDDQQTILSKDWRRIYTTNYDDAVEWHHSDKLTTPRPKSYSFEDPLPSRVLPGTIVHLHGYIHHCTKDSVLQQLVLSHYSYAEQAAKSSPWWTQFEKDLRTAETIFFVGYSLSDFEAASYLTKNPSFASKCNFVLRPSNDPVLHSRIEDYGQLHEIALNGFAMKCKSLVPRTPVKNLHALKAFRYFDPNKDSKAPSGPTPVEIETLMTLGAFKLQRLLSTFPMPSYIIPRTVAVAEAVDALKGNKTLILHSKIGNGKSIFSQCLAMRLSELGHRCFECRDDVTIPEGDIEFLRQEEKPIIIFPSYDTAYAAIEQLTGLNEAVRFVVEMNTGTLQVRRTEVHSLLDTPIERMDLNRLTAQDIGDLHQLLDKAGIAPHDMKLKFRAGTEIRDIVLSLYSNQLVASKIKKLVTPMLADPEFKRILCCVFILKSLGVKVDSGFLRMVTRIDTYDVLDRFGENALEIVSFDLDQVEPHSALLSEYLIRNLIDPNDLVDWVYWLCAEAAKRTHDDGNLQSPRSRNARHALGMLLTHSRLRDFFARYNNKDDLIESLYERGRTNSNINAEPLFWLQYSIFMQDKGTWPLAEKLMETAYNRAKHRVGFQTYQLDTNSFSLLLDIEKQEINFPTVTRFEVIYERLGRLNLMLSDGNHRGHALRVLLKIEEFVKRRGQALSNSEAVRLIYDLHVLANNLDAYNDQEKAESGSEKVKVSLNRAIGVLSAQHKSPSN